MGNSPHLLKKSSLFAMFCLSYSPLFFLLGVKIVSSKWDYIEIVEFSLTSFLFFLKEYWFVLLLSILIVFSIIGSFLTFKNLNSNVSNAFPVKINSIKPKNEEALSYLATYVLPLLSQGNIGSFEYLMFIVLFVIYYKLYSTSSLILINPILNMKYGLYELDYVYSNDKKEIKNAMIISNQKYLEEDHDLKLIKLGHRLYFAY